MGMQSEIELMIGWVSSMTSLLVLAADRPSFGITTLYSTARTFNGYR
jgi:hypothetical protein